MPDDVTTSAVPPQSRRWPLRWRAVAQPRTAEDIAVRDIAAQEAQDELPPPPEPETAPSERFNMAVLRLAGLGLALVLTLGITLVRLFVGGPPSVAELRAQAGVDAWRELTVGVKDDQPGIAFYDRDKGVWSGFDIDIAYMIAADLGFRPDEVKFYASESEDRARMQATDPRDNNRRVPVNLVIASYSVTADREARPDVTFSEPYLFTEQSVVTLADHDPVVALRDLRDRKVCTLSTSTSSTALEDAGAEPVQKNRVSECFKELDARRVEAVSTDAAILAGYKSRHGEKYRHWDLGLDQAEAWGVNVGENTALKKLVDLTLYRSYQDPTDDRWETAFRDHLQVQVGKNIENSRLTPIAVGQQPRPARPDVRELPWEDVLP